MEAKRIIVSTVLNNSMNKESLRLYDEFCIRPRAISDIFEYLKDKDFISALKFTDRALIGTLQEGGIAIDANPIKISLKVGDILLVLETDVKREELSTEDYLPEGSTISVTAYEIWNPVEYAKAIIDGNIKVSK